MCQGFGVVVTKDGRYLFCEPMFGGDCSHSMILDRAGIKENEDPFVRSFVRVQFPMWLEEGFEFDEVGTLPGWVDEAEIREKSSKLLLRVSPLFSEYEKTRGVKQAAFAKKRNKLLDEFKGDPLKEGFAAKYAPLLNPFLDECVSLKGALISSLSSITGYCKEA